MTAHTHAKLYTDVYGRVTAHASPTNGQVHTGHPSSCSSPSCIIWGRALATAQEDQELLDRVNANLRANHDEGMHLVAWTVISAAIVFAVAAAWFIWRFL